MEQINKHHWPLFFFGHHSSPLQSCCSQSLMLWKGIWFCRGAWGFPLASMDKVCLVGLGPALFRTNGNPEVLEVEFWNAEENLLENFILLFRKLKDLSTKKLNRKKKKRKRWKQLIENLRSIGLIRENNQNVNLCQFLLCTQVGAPCLPTSVF